MFRVPIPGVVAFAEEKIRAEAATMSYIAAHTTIRVPRVYYHGTAAEDSTGLGLPFMIVEYIGHNYNMAELLEEPTLVKRPELDTKLVIQHLFQQLANIYLQIAQLQSSRISALGTVNGQIVPDGPPRTWLFNNQFSLYQIPEAVFAPIIAASGNAISTSRQWHVSIANTYIAGLLYDQDQDQDLGPDAERTRSDFVARYLFRELALKRKFPLFPDDDRGLKRHEGSARERFRFWCDDLRPHNVLCNEQGDVEGVIDWEFAYFAPESYTYDAPFWLAIDRFPNDVLDTERSNGAPNKQPDTTTREKGDNKEDAEQKEVEGIPSAHYSIAESSGTDFEFDEDIEGVRKMFMHALQLEEQKLSKQAMERSQAFTKRDDSQAPLVSEHSHIHLVGEQLSNLSIEQNENKTAPSLLHELMTQRWEKQRNEFVWNFSHRWNRDVFTLWYWNELDREHGGPDSRGDYHERLDLLPERVKDLMEWFVHKRGKERDNWDPVKLMEAVLGQMDGTGPFVTNVVD